MKILSMSEFIPECFCDTVRFSGYTGDRNIAHYCGYASDFISQVMYDDSVDGAVFPKSCDSTRIMRSYLDKTDKFIYQLPVPTGRDAVALDYFTNILKDFETRLLNHYHFEQIDIKSRIHAINERNISIKDIYDKLDDYSFYSVLDAIHEMLQKPLMEQKLSTSSITAGGDTGKRVYLVGSFLSNTGIAQIIEESGLRVVGAYLPEVGRLASAREISVDGDMYCNVAEYILSMHSSPTQDRFLESVETTIKDIHARKASGIIFVTQKYCEAYDYYYYRIFNSLKDSGIPMLQIALSDSQDEGKSRLQAEAFAEML